MIDFKDELPRSAHMYPILLAHINSSLNPILYAFTNSNFKRGYINFFYFLFDKKNYLFSIRASSKSKSKNSTIN